MSARPSVLVGAWVVLVVVYLWGVYWPLQEDLEAARAEWTQSVEREAQATRLEELTAQLGPVLGGPRDISLVTTLDQVLRARNLKDRVVQMQSQPPKGGKDGTPKARESAQLRLDRLDLEQLNRALEAMDNLASNIWVRSLEVRRTGKDEALAVFQIDALETE